MKKHRKVISCILACCICISLLTFLGAIDLKLGLCSEKNVMHSINTTGYSEGAYKELHRRLKDLAKERNLDYKVLKKSINEETFLLDSASSISKSLKGKRNFIDTADLEIQTEKNIRLYLAKYNIPVTEGLLQSIDETVTIVKNYYISHGSFNFGKYFYEYKNNFNKADNMVISFSAIFTLVFSAFLLRLYRHKHRALRYVAGSVGVAIVADMFIITYIFIMRTKFLIGASSYYIEFILTFINSSLVVATALCAIAVVLLIVILLLIRHFKIKLG